jgi:twitching motility two-component system response regulator PilG
MDNERMTRPVPVGIMGFSPQEKRYLQKIFALSNQDAPSYKLADMDQTEPVAILLVKKMEASALQQQQAYQAKYPKNPLVVVTVGKEPATPEDTYYIRGVLIPSRVFAVLNNIQIPSETTNPIEQAIEIQSPVVTEIEKIPAVSNALQVLVVDDSQLMQKTIQIELNQATIPLTIDFADTGEQALEQVKLKKYDFIFLDVVMPGIDGFETCSQMRTFEGMAKTPIIMLTSKTSAMDEVKGLMAGCTTYLTKPFEHDEFHSMLERIVSWVKEFNDRK